MWQKALQYVLSVYELTATSPKLETDGLSSQMRRAAVSVTATIVEGFRKRGRPDKVRFMNSSEGSLEDSRYYLMLAQDLGYCQTSTLTASLEEASRLLNAYSKAIASSNF